MAFEKKTWKNRVSDFPNRRMLTDTNSNSTVYTVARYEGNVSEEGDAFNAENMNDLEGRIDEVLGNAAFSVEGDKVYVIFENSLGTVVKKALGSLDPSVLTATPTQVLSGYTFGGRGSDESQTGTMTNRGAYTYVTNYQISGNDLYVRIPTGAYLNLGQSGYPEIVAQELLETANATPGTTAQTIYPSSGKALKSVTVGAINTQMKTATPLVSQQTITPDSGKYLSSVVVRPVYTQCKNFYQGIATSATLDIDLGGSYRLIRVCILYGGYHNSDQTGSGTFTVTCGSSSYTESTIATAKDNWLAAQADATQAEWDYRDLISQGPQAGETQDAYNARRAAAYNDWQDKVSRMGDAERNYQKGKEAYEKNYGQEDKAYARYANGSVHRATKRATAAVRDTATTIYDTAATSVGGSTIERRREERTTRTANNGGFNPNK